MSKHDIHGNHGLTFDIGAIILIVGQTGPQKVFQILFATVER